MRLNLQTDYSLRVLMALAASGRQMSVDEIAGGYGISRNHLAKVAQRLQALGYITATRGRGGGVRLAVAPEQVNLGRVVRAFESLEGFVDCMDSTSPGCVVAGVCGLKHALGEALADFLARLDSYTLADLVLEPASFLARLDRSNSPIAGRSAAVRAGEGSTRGMRRRADA
jgi:Rrf2 family nitric oxide-sensitive transcriptional repressor